MYFKMKKISSSKLNAKWPTTLQQSKQFSECFILLSIFSFFFNVCGLLQMLGQGGYSQNFCNFRPWYLEFFKTKSAFLKQISLEVDITYIISSIIPIFDVKLVLKSRLKLRKFYKFVLKSVVNMAQEKLSKGRFGIRLSTCFSRFVIDYL